LGDHRRERGEVRRGGRRGGGAQIAERNQLAERSEVPVGLDLAQKDGGSDVGGTGLVCWLVLRSEGGPHCFQADPVARALVAKDGPPAAGAVEAAVRTPADGIGAGAGDNENAGASCEACIEGDLLIAAKKERPPRARRRSAWPRRGQPDWTGRPGRSRCGRRWPAIRLRWRRLRGVQRSGGRWPLPRRHA
jgi:hypothetical protein